MHLPDYKGGSIVNLMSSIGNSLGAKMPYQELRILPSNELRNSKNVVLMVIDGLGFEYLMRKQGSFLKDNVRGRITSVFPPTTAAGVGTFLTGVAAQQHALTGWFMFLKEIGILAKILPFTPRIGGASFDKQGIKMEDILGQEAFTNKINAKSIVINPKMLMNSAFNETISKKSKREFYSNFDSFINQIRKAINSKGKRKYIYAYWPDIDTFSHEFGVGSSKHEKHFKEIDKKIKKFIEKTKGTNTTLIITADHGLTNTAKDKVILLKDHPRLLECLIMPRSGEGRLAYFYVHPAKARQFEWYVKTHLGKYCWMYKSEELIKKNVFGLGVPNKKLFDRVGDYILVMKENYILKDVLLGEHENKNIGHHGGVSKEEMYVPLIVFNC
jgi:hypothetical protein